MTTELANDMSEDAEIERIPTRVPGLDRVCGGGTVLGALYLVMGRPGTGKTTLGNQLCFAHAKAGGRAVYVTMLSESHAAMLRNLRRMAFFDESVRNTHLHYVGAYKALREHGLRALLDVLRRVIMDRRASLLVLDGVSPARAHAANEIALKEFIVELQALCSLTACTGVLLANMTNEDANGPEHTMVDGLIELAFERSGRRTNRSIEVIKFRANEHLLGRHELVITSEGITVLPRIEDEVNTRAHEPQALDARVSSGIPQLDLMLGGGFLAGTTSIVLGFSGSGKTTLTTHFLHEGMRRKEHSIYFGFYEPPGKLLSAAEALGLSLGGAAPSPYVEQIWQPSYEHGLDGLGRKLLDGVRRVGARRLVIDGLDGFRQAAVNPDRTLRFVTALTNELRGLGVTTLLTEETSRPYGPEIATRVEGTSALADSIVLLEYVTVGTVLRRLVSVIKQRETAHDLSVREFRLTPRGLAVSSDSESALDILNSDAPISARNRMPRQHRPSE